MLPKRLSSKYSVPAQTLQVVHKGSVKTKELSSNSTHPFVDCLCMPTYACVCTRAPRAHTHNFKVRSKNGEPVGKFLYLGKYAPYTVATHIIRKHVTRWSQISGQINSIDPVFVDTAYFLKETPPMHYRQRILPVNDTHDTNCTNHCYHSRRLLAESLHCLKSPLHLLL